MHLKIEESSKKEKTGFVLRAAILHSFIKEVLCLHDFFVLDLLVNAETFEWVSVAPDNRYYLETIGIFVLREKFPGLLEKFACHQIIFMVHSQNAFAKELIVLRCLVY